MLKRVVEHGDVGALRARLGDRRDAIGRDDHRDVGIQPRVHERLVVAVAAQHDRRLRAALAASPARSTRRSASSPFRRRSDCRR